jgi:hypothetical protein
MELHAAAVVAEQLGGTEEMRDGVDAPDGMHDFDINLPDGRSVALEVTAIADPDVVGFHNLMGDTTWIAPGLRTDWWVGLPEPAPGRPAMRVKRQKPTIVSVLRTLEAHEISALEGWTLEPSAPLPCGTPPAVLEAITTLSQIGVLFVRSTGRRPDDAARLLFTSHGSATSNPGQLNDLVTERVQAKHEKLAAAEASERHLFIWLTDSYPDAEMAFSMLAPPMPPAIPAVLDVIWLATWAWPIRLWRLRPPGGWEVIDASGPEA